MSYAVQIVKPSETNLWFEGGAHTRVNYNTRTEFRLLLFLTLQDEEMLLFSEKGAYSWPDSRYVLWNEVTPDIKARSSVYNQPMFLNSLPYEMWTKNKESVVNICSDVVSHVKHRKGNFNVGEVYTYFKDKEKLGFSWGVSSECAARL